MASFGVNNLVNALTSKAKESVTQYLGITTDPDIIMSPIYTTRDMSSDYFLVKVHSFIPKTRSEKYVDFRIPDSFNLGLKSTFSSLVEGKLGIVSTINKLLQAGSSLSGSLVSLNTKFTTAQIWEGSSPVSITIPIELNATQDINNDVFDKIINLSSMVLPREGDSGDWTDMFLRAPGPTPLDISNDPMLKALKNPDSGIYNSLRKGIDSIESVSTLNYIPYIGSSITESDTLESAKQKAKDQLNELPSKITNLEQNDPGENIDITIGRILTFKRCIITDISWDFDCTRLLNGSGLPMRVSGKMAFKTTTAMTAGDFKKALKVESSVLPFDLVGTIDSSLGLGGNLSNFVNKQRDKFKDLT